MSHIISGGGAGGGDNGQANEQKKLSNSDFRKLMQDKRDSDRSQAPQETAEGISSSFHYHYPITFMHSPFDSFLTMYSLLQYN